MEHPSLLPLERASDALRKVGGKAATLVRVARKGLALPPTWILDAEPFRDLVETRLPPGHDPHAVLKITRTRERVDRAARARDLVLDAMLPEGLVAALSALFRGLAAMAPHGLAVRGSPTVVDDTAATGGIGKAVLGVRSEQALLDAVRSVWAATYLPRSLEHFQRRGVRDVAMAVIVQPMLVPDACGVLATQPGRGERLASAAFGFGSPVIHGVSAVDLFRLDAAGVVLASQIADKPRALRLAAGTLASEATDPSAARGPALTGVQCQALAELARALDQTGIGPCHVSFAFVGDTPWTLEVQVDAPPSATEGGDASSVWSRASVGESLPSVISPLAWSLTEGFVETSIRKSLDTLGCSLPRGARVLSNVHGRVYANVSAVLRAAADLPGLDPAMLGALAAVPGQEATVARTERARAASYARLPVTAARLLALQTGLGRDVEAFEETCEDARRLLADLDLAILPDDALVPTLRDARTLLDRTSDLVSGTTTAHVASHLLLGTVLLRAFPTSASAMAMAITTGAGQLPCAQAALALGRVADVARVDPEAGRALARGEALPDGPTRRALATFLDDHGDRALREDELALPRWRESPAPVLAMLAALAAATEMPAALASARAREADAWTDVERRVPFFELGLVRTLAARGRRFTELRDRIWTCHTKVLAMVRAVAVEADRRLCRVDPSLGRGAAFFCTYEELCAALGTGRPEVAHIVRLRRDQDARDRDVPDPPPRFVGTPLLLTGAPFDGPTLAGVGASGGTAEGTVRIVRDDADAAAVRAGDVLVVRSADAALSPLFLVASAVVAELGGPMGHGAVVARELGVPAVVHAFGATTKLCAGERVRVDGGAGTITRQDER